jgi:hypothetical protein
MIIFKKEDDIPTEQNYFKTFLPLTWRRFHGCVVIVCPNEHYLSVWNPAIPPEKNHTISSDGTVTPSVVCSIEGCGFHDFIKLEGWK